MQQKQETRTGQPSSFEHPPSQSERCERCDHVEREQAEHDCAGAFREFAEPVGAELRDHRVSPFTAFNGRSPWTITATRNRSIAVDAIISKRPNRCTCSTVVPLGGSAIR